MRIVLSLGLVLMLSPPHPSFFSLKKENQTEVNQNSLLSDHLLIITVDKYKPECTGLVNHKENANIHSILSTTSSIYKNYYGKDNQEKIKYCIKQAYDTYHISSVLLIGDFNDIPVRYCYNNDGYHSLELCFISDLYYADIYDSSGRFSSWDTDQDGIYGEWDGDTADDDNISLIPEISIGRLPCSNRFEVETMIQKIIAYESSSKYQNWFHRFVVAAGDTYSEARGYNDEVFHAYEGEVIASEAIDIMNDFEPTTLFASEGTLSTFSVYNAINQGCGFLFFSGHGSPGVWCTHPPHSAEKVGIFPTYLMPLLRNKNKLPICIVGGCQNSQFDVHPLRIFKDPYYYGTWRDGCWSWKLTKSSYGGSIATIGCTGLSWMGIEFGGGGSDWLNVQFFREYANGTTILGDIWKNVITAYIETHPIDWNTASGTTSSIDAKTVQEWTLIGDPTLNIEV